MKKFRFRNPVLIFLCIVALTLIATGPVLGGPNPPSGDEQLKGPNMQGRGTITPYSETSVLVKLTVKCKEVECELGEEGGVEILIPFSVFEVLQEEAILWMRLGDVGLPSECSECDREGVLIIHSVQQFKQEDEKITVKVSVMYVTGK